MNKMLFYIIILSFLQSCDKPKTDSVIEIDNLLFKSDQEIIHLKTKPLVEGRMLNYRLKNLNIEMTSSYYSNNLYEYDIIIVHPDEIDAIKQYEYEKVPFIISKSKRDIDLDYYRKYNVFFDTINGITLKELKPRIAYKHEYIFFIAKIPGTFKKHIGYKSLTLSCNNIKSVNDYKLFRSLVYSVTRR